MGTPGDPSELPSSRFILARRVAMVLLVVLIVLAAVLGVALTSLTV